MTLVTDEMVNAALLAFHDCDGDGPLDDIRAALEAVAPIIAKEVQERCIRAVNETTAPGERAPAAYFANIIDKLTLA